MNILARMIGLLTSAYRKSDEYNVANDIPVESNIGRLFAVFGWGLELIQKNAERVRLWASIDYAEGKVLDRYGANFGVPRGNATDEFYRMLIKVKLISQLSGGDLDTVIDAAAALYDIPPDKIDLKEIFPAKLRLYLDPNDIAIEKQNYAALINKMMKRIIAAGVGFSTTYKIPAHVYICAHPSTLSRISVLPLFVEPESSEARVMVGATAHYAHKIKVQPKGAF